VNLEEEEQRERVMAGHRFKNAGCGCGSVVWGDDRNNRKGEGKLTRDVWLETGVKVEIGVLGLCSLWLSW